MAAVRGAPQLVGTPCAAYKPRTAQVERARQSMCSSALCDALRKCSIEIRPVEPADMGAVRDMFAAGMSAYAHLFDPHSKLHKFWLRYIDGSLSDDLSDFGVKETYTDTGGFWVAADCNTGRIVGCVGAQRLSDSHCELRRMSVGQNDRKRGVAQLLVWWLEEWATEQQFQQVVLTTGSVMVPAKALYLAAGYELYEIRTVGGPQKVTRADGSIETFDMQQLAFRKALTSNSGRWVWSAHTPVCKL